MKKSSCTNAVLHFTHLLFQPQHVNQGGTGNSSDRQSTYPEGPSVPFIPKSKRHDNDLEAASSSLASGEFEIRNICSAPCGTRCWDLKFLCSVCVFSVLMFGGFFCYQISLQCQKLHRPPRC